MVVSKIEYYKKFFLTNKSNMKKLWSGIKSIINIKKCPNSLVTSLNELTKAYLGLKP